MKNYWALSIVLVFSFITTIGSVILYQKKSKSYEAQTPTWEDLALASLSEKKAKNRIQVENQATRSIASEKEDRILKKSNKAYSIGSNNIVNVQKNKLHGKQIRLSAKSLTTGEDGYLSGEIIISGGDPSDAPINLGTTKISIVREFSKNEFLLSVSPPTDVLKVYDYLLSSNKFEKIDLDIIEKAIEPK